jgi:hypothetical protein
MLFSHLRLSLPSGLLLSGFLTKPLSTAFSAMRVMCSTHLTLVYLIILIICDEGYEL